eukprot:277439_1
MGSTTSLHHSPLNNCGDVCNCFLSDKSVTKTKVIRNCKCKWIWSKNHDLILKRTLNSNYNIPTDITSIIKEHTYCKNKDYFICKPVLCQEAYYTITKRLLSKRLCFKWYKSQCSAFEAFPIALIGNNGNVRQHIFDTFVNHKSSLLSLRSQYSEEDNSKRTIYIDRCCVSVRVSNINLEPSEFQKLDTKPKVVLCIIEKNDDIIGIDNMIQKMKNINKCNKMNFILAQIGNEFDVLRKFEINQLCRKYNISCIETILNCEKSIHDMFIYAVKCYWFSMVSRNL